MDESRKNLVILCLDTFRWDIFSGRAPWQVALPHLAKLRTESVQFTRAFGEGQPTIPIRRAYFTGERSFPWRYDFDTKGLWPTGRGWHKIPPEQPTLSEVLFDHGYQTGLIADTYHMFKSTMNFTRGFLTYEFVRGYESDNYRGGTIGPKDLVPYVRDPEPAKHPVLVQHLLNTRGRRYETDWSTAQVFLKAADWVQDHAGAPFFLWVDSFAPHEPWDPPRGYAEPYFSDPHFDGIEYIYPLEHLQDEQGLSPAEINRVRELYFGHLSFVDRWIGHLVDTLQKTGQWDRTILMIVSDHGTELMDHGQFSKAASRLYAHNTQLIWSVRNPGTPAQDCNAFVQSHDLFPTALHLLGVPHESVAGRNAWDWVGTSRTGERPFIVTGWGSYASVRSNDWSYFVNFEHPENEEWLFDLKKDPHEDENVLGSCSHEAHEMRSRLEEFLGQQLPAKLSDVLYHTDAPIRRYYKSEIDQKKRDAGFV